MGPSPEQPMKLGRIGFLNVLPLYYPLESGILEHPFRIISGTPAYLNGLMARGEMDLSVVSSIEYARNPQRYFVVPDLSIGCRGAVQSVLLLSRVPFSALEGETILMSTQSHTSVALLKILLALRLGVRAGFESACVSDALAGGAEPQAFLAIGDEALRLRNHPRYPHRLDLGEAWHDWTGLPFVFALWVIQRQAVDRWNRRVDPALDALRHAREWGCSHLEVICEEAARQGLLTVPELRSYYGGLRFDLEEDARKGLELFYAYLQQLGELTEAPRLELYSSLARVA